MISEKRKQAASILLFAAIFILTTAEWNVYEWYMAVNPYGTLFASVMLAGCFFCCVNMKDALRDPVFWLMGATDVYALINLFLVRSHYGAILTIADFLLICYLANKMICSEKMLLLGMALPAFYFFYWTIDVKGYFKGYNTNYGGLILITGFSCLMVLITYLRGILKEKQTKPAYLWGLLILQLFFFALCYNIIAWYRSRCALVGLVVVTILILIPKKAFLNRVFYTFLCFLTTFGAILVSAVYVWLGRVKDVFRIRIFYKDILSGREELWEELWLAYLKHPVTGIGSAYKPSDGAFEVHNGMLDLLFVHGIAVFIVACLFLFLRLLRLRKTIGNDEVAKILFASMAAILCTSFFENFVIVPPFSLILLMLFAAVNQRMVSGTDPV